MDFWLGTHQPHWLEQLDVPLFVSRRRLAGRRRLPRARGPWALDSGGFSEISAHGGWTISARAYAAEVRRYREAVGNLAWAAVQDWMCEPWMLTKTGLSVTEHQFRTVASCMELREIAPEVPWVPVLQGWTTDDYRRHVDQYQAGGVDLQREALVGLGSVCRRQHTQELVSIIRALQPLRLHGFGVKLQGLDQAAQGLASADSMAWSFAARRRPALPGCSHRNCANCARYALLWYERVLRRIARSERRPRQLSLFEKEEIECSDC